MSQIAHALAKAKERTGQTTVPFLGAGSSQPTLDAARAAASAAALRRAKTRQRFWLILALVALPLTGFIFWTQIGSPNVSLPSSGAPAPTAQETASVAPTPAASVSSSPGPSSTRKDPALRLELIQAVKALPISAVMPGDPARIMLAGKIVRAGETVGEGLVFSGLADGQLRFTDTQGAVYTRYY